MLLTHFAITLTVISLSFGRIWLGLKGFNCIQPATLAYGSGETRGRMDSERFKQSRTERQIEKVSSDEGEHTESEKHDEENGSGVHRSGLQLTRLIGRQF